MRRTKLICLGVEIFFFLFTLQYIFYGQSSLREEEKMKKFFHEKTEYGFSDKNYPYIITKEDSYIGIIEIPTIHLKAGFYTKESKLNSVEYGIEVIKSSKMPNEGGNLILAAHSGTSSISYFKKIHLLKENDIIYIYYNGIQYVYQLNLIYEEDRRGSIFLPKVGDRTLLTLTTCKEDKQLILVSRLVFSQVYQNE